MGAPDFLYKYRGFNAYSLSSLANQTIWLSRPSSFNDPFDCAITLDQGLYKESIIHAVTESLKINGSANDRKKELFKLWPGDKEAFDEYRNGIREILQNMGVCSFSESADTLLLWSHYADHHKGFCIEYDCNAESSLSKTVRKVMYSDSVPKISAADITGQNRDEAFDMLWLTKANAGNTKKWISRDTHDLKLGCPRFRSLLWPLDHMASMSCAISPPAYASYDVRYSSLP